MKSQINLRSLQTVGLAWWEVIFFSKTTIFVLNWMLNFGKSSKIKLTSFILTYCSLIQFFLVMACFSAKGWRQIYTKDLCGEYSQLLQLTILLLLVYRIYMKFRMRINGWNKEEASKSFQVLSKEVKIYLNFFLERK
jgi:hypothetical protein